MEEGCGEGKNTEEYIREENVTHNNKWVIGSSNSALQLPEAI